MIRYKQIGPVTPEILAQKKLVPLVKDSECVAARFARYLMLCVLALGGARGRTTRSSKSA